VKKTTLYFILGISLAFLLGSSIEDGVTRTFSFDAHIIEEHFHTQEYWLGISGDQSGNDWAADTLNVFQAISGANDYGGDADDEAKVLGTADTPMIAGNITFDVRQILIEDVSVDTVWKLRIAWGTTTVGNAVAAGDYTEIMLQFDSTNPQQSAGIPISIRMPRLTAGSDQVWIEAWNATDNATIDFFVGIHEYDD
jgi:hypothetical protein